MQQQARRLAAILFTDIVGSTTIMQSNEQLALSMNMRYVTVLKQCVLLHNGEILNDYGDGSLCVFNSATEAVYCAIEMQQQLQTGQKVPLRIGLHVGEIFFQDEKVFGDGVNVASRIQSLGVANSILFSPEIYSKLKNQQAFKSISIGKFHFKNVDEPMEVFALANDGLTVPKKEELTGKLKEISKKSARGKWMGIIAAAALLIVAFFIYRNFYHLKGFYGGDKTVAVLPFENVGMDSSEIYLSDGITQDIISSLSKISSLQKVIGWFSVKGFRKTSKSLAEISKELDVAAIFSGTIEKQSDKTNITVELIEASTGKRLWGDDFEYESKDILSIKSKIAGEIVHALSANITPEEKKELSHQYTENPEANKLYRKGIFFWNKNGQANFDSAEVYYKKALDIDPDYALAYSGLANCYIFSRKISSQLEGIPIAKIYTTKALSLDSNLCESLTTLGWIQGAFDYDWKKSKTTLEKAIKLNPNYADAHLFYGNLLQYTGENATKGINEIKRALELDPLNNRYNWVLGRNYYLSHQDDLALEQYKKTLILDPSFIPAKSSLVLLYLQTRMYAEAFELIKQLPKIPITNLIFQDPLLSYAYAIEGDTTRAKNILESTLKKFPKQSPEALAYVYVALKNYNEALNMLDAAYENRDIDLYWVKVNPIFDPLRSDPRFIALMKKMNLN